MGVFLAVLALSLVSPASITAAASPATPGMKAWGFNVAGQLGDGSTDSRRSPVPVKDLTGVKAVAAGGGHTVAVRQDGSVYAWGQNFSGQLGVGTTTQRHVTPVPVKGLPGKATTVAAGGSHSVVVLEDGSVHAWGDNVAGQLGDGSTDRRPSPVPVKGLTGVKAVATSSVHTVAVRQDGSVYAWGQNISGQLGDGTTTQRRSPVPVKGLPGKATTVAAGYGHSVALLEDGSVYAWGDNISGQVGDGTATKKQLTPVLVKGLPGKATTVAAGSGHNVAVLADGSVYAWGRNDYGQLGVGSTAKKQVAPVPVNGLLGEATTVAAGARHSVAVLADGSVNAWGSNDVGQLGGTKKYLERSPVPVQGLTDAQTVAAGGAHSVAIVTTGTPHAGR